MTTEITRFRELEAVRLRAADGASAVVTRHGAHVVSWIPDGLERLFLSELGAMDRRAPIRGGVPVIFPQFATYGSLPHHGLVRTRDWVLTADGVDGGAAYATFRIEDSDETRRLWPIAFRCELTVSVSAPRLELALRVENPGPAPFTFCAALHTYLRVDDVRSARLEGLQGTRYRDRTDADREHVETASTLIVGDEVDRIYMQAPSSLRVQEASRGMRIDADGFPDVVVWNPWVARSKLLPDLADEAYLDMLCVEAAAVVQPLTLAPGASWRGSQTLTCVQQPVQRDRQLRPPVPRR
jgi:glucose-6-phosphate 1-epimerase